MRSSTGFSRIVEGLIGSSSWDGCGVVVDGRMSVVVVDGSKSVVVVDGRRLVQRHPRGRPGCKARPDTLEAHPHPRVHCPSHTSLRVVVHPACHA